MSGSIPLTPFILISKQFRNAPLVIDKLTAPLTFQLPFSQQSDPGFDNNQEYYYLINGTDPVAQPTIQVVMARGDIFTFVSNESSTPLTSIDLNYGEAGYFVKKRNSDTTIFFYRVNAASIPPGDLPIATLTSTGILQPGSEFTITTAGLLGLANELALVNRPSVSTPQAASSGLVALCDDVSTAVTNTEQFASTQASAAQAAAISASETFTTTAVAAVTPSATTSTSAATLTANETFIATGATPGALTFPAPTTALYGKSITLLNYGSAAVTTNGTFSVNGSSTITTGNVPSGQAASFVCGPVSATPAWYLTNIWTMPTAL